MQVSQDGTSVVPYNEAEESILYKYEIPDFILEYAKNKLLVTGDPHCMYLVDNFSTVKLITDPNTSNIYKTDAFVMPKFDETAFPFIVVCGVQHISILNITTLEHKPLVTGLLPIGRPGL